MTDPILPALTDDTRPGDHVETGVRGPLRCAECNCEHGGVDCNWIKAGPDDREESMGDERLIETVAREIHAWQFMADPDGEPRHGYAHWDSGTGDAFFERMDSVRHARKVAARLPAALRSAGFAIVATEGPEFEAAVERAIAEVRKIDAEEYGSGVALTDHERSELSRILRAALTPGDANG